VPGIFREQRVGCRRTNNRSEERQAGNGDTTDCCSPGNLHTRY
jgi:hypothetical protein